MEIFNFKEVKKGCIVAKFCIDIPKWDMKIYNCTWLNKNGHQWITLPQEVYETAEGKKYFQVVRFGEDTQKRFQEKILSLLNALVADNSSADEQDYDQGVPF